MPREQRRQQQQEQQPQQPQRRRLQTLTELQQQHQQPIVSITPSHSITSPYPMSPMFLESHVYPSHIASQNPSAQALSSTFLDHRVQSNALHFDQMPQLLLHPQNNTLIPLPTVGAQYGDLDDLSLGNSPEELDYDELSNQGSASDELRRTGGNEQRRQRNTAASARFRQKKKEREAALERRVAELTEQCEQLDRRIRTLELENRVLREQLME